MAADSKSQRIVQKKACIWSTFQKLERPDWNCLPQMEVLTSSGSIHVRGWRLQKGTVRTVSGADVDLGLPTNDHQEDWLVIVRRAR